MKFLVRVSKIVTKRYHIEVEAADLASAKAAGLKAPPPFLAESPAQGSMSAEVVRQLDGPACKLSYHPMSSGDAYQLSLESRWGTPFRNEDVATYIYRGQDVGLQYAGEAGEIIRFYTPKFEKLTPEQEAVLTAPIKSVKVSDVLKSRAP